MTMVPVELCTYCGSVGALDMNRGAALCLSDWIAAVLARIPEAGRMFVKYGGNTRAQFNWFCGSERTYTSPFS